MSTPVQPETSPPDRNRITRVTDSAGRVLGVQRPGMLQRMRLLEAAGAENARIEKYMDFAFVASAVVEIDGELCEAIMTKRQLEARVLLLEEHGMIAVDSLLSATADQVMPI